MTSVVSKRESPTAAHSHLLVKGPISNRERFSERELKACTSLVSNRVTKHMHCASTKLLPEWIAQRKLPSVTPPVHIALPTVNPRTEREKITSLSCKGRRFMRSGVGGSTARATAANPSDQVYE